MMAESMGISRLAVSLAAAALLAALGSPAQAGPIGYVQSTGGLTVQPAGNQAPVRISGENYTLFASDRIDTRHGSAVITLNGGGTIGLARGSSAVIEQNNGRGLSVSLDRGALTYSLPSAAGAFDVRVDGVTFAATSSATGAELSGVLQIDENRQVDAFARSGDIAVRRPSASAAQATSVASVGSTNGSQTGVVSTQAFDTLTSVSQGNSARVQANADASANGLSVVSTPVAQSVGATASSEIALVGGAQGTTMVVADDKADEGIQSVSP